jgi:hypothetical protein
VLCHYVEILLLKPMRLLKKLKSEFSFFIGVPTPFSCAQKIVSALGEWEVCQFSQMMSLPDHHLVFPFQCVDQVHDVLFHVLDGRCQGIILHFRVEVQRPAKKVFR